jgi:hypothetical protein
MNPRHKVRGGRSKVPRLLALAKSIIALEGQRDALLREFEAICGIPALDYERAHFRRMSHLRLRPVQDAAARRAAT